MNSVSRSAVHVVLCHATDKRDAQVCGAPLHLAPTPRAACSSSRHDHCVNRHPMVTPDRCAKVTAWFCAGRVVRRPQILERDPDCAVDLGAVLEAPALIPGLDGLTTVGEPTEKGGGYLAVTQDGRPLTRVSLCTYCTGRRHSPFERQRTPWKTSRLLLCNSTVSEYERHQCPLVLFHVLRGVTLPFATPCTDQVRVSPAARSSNAT